MKTRVYIAVLLFATVLVGCGKLEYDQEVKQQMPIDFRQIYLWLGQPYHEVEASLAKYQQTGRDNFTAPDGVAFHRVTLPNYGESGIEGLDFLITLESNWGREEDGHYVQRTQVSKVHERAETYAPSDELFIGIITNVMKPICASPGVGIKAWYDIWMADGAYLGNRRVDPAVDDTCARNPNMVPSEKIPVNDGVGAPLGYAKLEGNSVHEWFQAYATNVEFSQFQRRVRDWVAAHGGNESVVKAQVRIELYGTKDWLALTDWSHALNQTAEIYEWELKDHVEFRVVRFSKTFQREGWKWKGRDGRDSVPAGYQNSVFDAQIFWHDKDM